MVILVIETEAKNNEYELIKRNPSKNRVTYRVDEYVHQNKGITSVQNVMRKKRKQSQYNNPYNSLRNNNLRNNTQ